MLRVRQIRSSRLAWGRITAPALELWPALLLLLIYAVAYVQFAAQLASFPFDFDQGEGYDAWSGWLINLGQLPYTSNASFPYYSSNYPPLWSYLVSIPMAWLGPGLGAARIVSTLAALATAGVLWIAARQLSGRTIGGVLAAGFFLASPYVFHTTPLARVNSLALLAAALGLTLLDGRLTRQRVIFGSLALAAALFTKPTAIDAAIAGVLAVLLRQPRLGALAAAVVAGVGAVGLGLLMLSTNGAFWLNVVAGNANPFDLQQLTAYLSNFSILHCVLLVLAIPECVRMLLRRQWSPWALYLLTSSVAALGVAKWGAGESYFLGVIASICVLSGVWVARFLDAAPSIRLRWALGIALIVQGLLLSHAELSSLMPWLPDRGPQQAFLGHAPTAADQQAGQLLATEIRGLDGPALSEDPSFAVVAGKVLVGNATQLRNLYEAGLWDPAPMVSDLQAHKYAIVILDAELYPEPVLAAIGRYYFLDRSVRVNDATYQVFLPGAQ
ncbi:MAG TPA: glycosyltransferase family 39 protein [Chloroflexota bacterium]